MEFTGERFVPLVEGDIQLEHLHRYHAARQVVHGKRVLDIACGEGYGSDILATAAASVIGVDVDDATVAHAQRVYSRANLSFLQGDCVAIPIGDASVDVVVSFETIEHLTDHNRMMREIKRVLTPVGVLVLSSPDKREYSDIPNYQNPYHLRELYLSELHELLSRHFAHHNIYGQRVVYASAIAPTTSGSVPFIGYRTDSGGVVEGTGLPNPVFLIAVASDDGVPDLPAGLFIPQRPPYLSEITALSERVCGHKKREAADGLRIASLQEELAGLQQKLAELEAHAALRVASLRGELDRQVAALEALNQAYLKSTSWRVTKPMRMVKSTLYLGLAQAVRFTYRTFPVPFGVKLGIKNYLFTHHGPTFRRTGAYLRWQQGRPHRPSTAAALPPPGPTEMSWAADGRREWQSYDSVKQRIRAILAQRRATVRYVPRPMIKLGEQDYVSAAARIDLPPSGDAPEVSVILPVFNELTCTIECILSLAAAADSISFEVIVANDASTDRTQEVLNPVPHLRLTNQPRNVGFLRNCNSAAQIALGHRLVFLNNDTQVSKGWLAGLLRAFDEKDGVGAVGPRVVYPSGALQEAGVRIRREGAVEMIGLNDAPDAPRWSYRRDVDYVSGVCMMLDRALFESLGGFADDLAPAYCEDLDLCLRIRARGLRVLYTPDAEISHHLSKTSNSVGNAYKNRLIARNMQHLADRKQVALDAIDDLRVIAFYLPQFHPVPENDLWWGPGFTDWTNVAKAKPNYVGHYQPRLPADLGYYDLRVEDVMDKQWDLAARYGVDGFCYYYYWFHGHRLLDGPLDRLLLPDSEAHPFCLCWANENWTRKWDGQDKEVLIAQRHSAEDDLAVIRDLMRYMRHAAYIKIRGRPLLLVYRTDLFPDFKTTAQNWREECRKLGLGEIYLAFVESFGFADANASPAAYGCDASVEFPAHNMPDICGPSGPLLNLAFEGRVADYETTAVRYATRRHPGFTRFRTVMPGWDNTARRPNNSFCLDNATPGAFQAWTEAVIAEAKCDLQGDARLVFVNAWNEWAEGAYLEPDRRFGHSFLEAIRNARDAGHLLRPAEER
jgi:GT2 family glycosyltransferase/SAM-dependent methyltransferase